MGKLRRALLTALPKVALSRVTGGLTRIPLPTVLRGPAYRAFARRYGVDLSEVAGALRDYRSLAAFFMRPLREGARPIADSPLVWPCDGRIVSAGPIRGDRLEQIKGQDYSLLELLRDEALAAALRGGSQATIYLSPRDYHRVHAPFDGTCTGTSHIPGALFPVNPPAVASIHPLFATNERMVFAFSLEGGRAAAVVMVAALNVGDIRPSRELPTELKRGDELACFGFGSTTIALVGPGGPAFAPVASETVVRVGAAAPISGDGP